MEWLQVLTIILGNFALIMPLFLWNRAENRADMRHMDTMIQANRELIREVHKEILTEMKDFHGRLCAIEERNKEK
ncbi:MAG: hypothetical protein ABFD00_10455 [Chloroherpetonaceae bacterium]